VRFCKNMPVDSLFNALSHRTDHSIIFYFCVKLVKYFLILRTNVDCFDRDLCNNKINRKAWAIYLFFYFSLLLCVKLSLFATDFWSAFAAFPSTAGQPRSFYVYIHSVQHAHTHFFALVLREGVTLVSLIALPPLTRCTHYSRLLHGYSSSGR